MATPDEERARRDAERCWGVYREWVHELRQHAAEPELTDPVVLEDINAELARTVYEATLRAERQRRGLEPPPPPSREARIILRRSLMPPPRRSTQL
jgi:hypothetical protein